MSDAPALPASVALALDARAHDLGEGFVVRRALPTVALRSVGSFVFLDHMGPVALPPGRGMDVRPHPHVCLATVTYLYDGVIEHRDSLGTFQPIEPGALNWMVAGRGIVHSERSPASARAEGARVHGLQFWMALSKTHEEVEPSFQHYDAHEVPGVDLPGARVRVVAGTAFGLTSPARTLADVFLVDVRLEPGAGVAVPDGPAERAVYVAEGRVRVDGAAFGVGSLVVLRAGARVEVVAAGGDAAEGAAEGARIALLGGAPLDGRRFMDWNFVASTKERIDEAKAAWREERLDAFPLVPGDEHERIPLPAPVVGG